MNRSTIGQVGRTASELGQGPFFPARTEPEPGAPVVLNPLVQSESRKMDRREALRNVAAGAAAVGAAAALPRAAEADEQPVRLSLPGGTEDCIGVYPSSVAVLESLDHDPPHLGRTEIVFRNGATLRVLEHMYEVRRLIGWRA